MPKEAISVAPKSVPLRRLSCCLRLSELPSILYDCPRLRHLEADIYWIRHPVPKPSDFRSLNALDAPSLRFQEQHSTLEFISDVTVLTSLFVEDTSQLMPIPDIKMPYLRQLSLHSNIANHSMIGFCKSFSNLTSLQLKSFSPASLHTELPATLKALTVLNARFPEAQELPHLTSLALVKVQRPYLSESLMVYSRPQRLRLAGWMTWEETSPRFFLDHGCFSGLTDPTLEIKTHRMEWMQCIARWTGLQTLRCIFSEESHPLSNKEAARLLNMKQLRVLGLSGIADYTRSRWDHHLGLWNGLDSLVIDISGCLDNCDYDIRERVVIARQVKVEIASVLFKGSLPARDQNPFGFFLKKYKMSF